MKKFILFIWALISVQFAFGQDNSGDGGTVYTDITDDSPYNIRNFTIGGAVSYNSNLGATSAMHTFPTGGLFFYTGRHFGLEGNYMISPFKTDTALKTSNIKAYTGLEVTLLIHFYDEEKTVSRRLQAHYASNGQSYRQSYWDQDLTFRIVKGMRLGYLKYNNYFQANIMTSQYYNGFEYVGFNSSAAYIGYFKEREVNTKLPYNGDNVKGIYTFKHVSETYIDFMFPVVTNFGNTQFPLVSTATNGDKIMRNAFGLRFGWMYHSTCVLGWYFRAETGAYSGYQQEAGYYLMAAFGICLSAHMGEHYYY